MIQISSMTDSGYDVSTTKEPTGEVCQKRLERQSGSQNNFYNVIPLIFTFTFFLILFLFLLYFFFFLCAGKNRKNDISAIISGGGGGGGGGASDSRS